MSGRDFTEIDGQILRAYVVDSYTVRLRANEGVIEIWTDDRPEWEPL